MTDALPAPLVARLRTLLRENAGLVLGDDKDVLVRNHLAAVALRHGLAGADGVLARLLHDPDSGLEREVVEAMTVRETSFFRDRVPFEALRTAILPGVIARATAGRPAVIWSAGCASGQEPFSLAMLAWEYFPEAAAAGAIRILATDLSRDVLARARTGRFSQLEINRGVPAGFMLRYFDQRGLTWQLRPHVAALVEFAPLNLAGAWPVMPRPEVVLARHVLMYLAPEARRDILARMADHLLPGGILFLGGTESMMGISDAFERVEVDKALCYRPRSRRGGNA